MLKRVSYWDFLKLKARVLLLEAKMKDLEQTNVRLHSAGFKIRIIETIDSHFLAEALENHGEIKKGDTFLTLKEHVKEPPK